MRRLLFTLLCVCLSSSAVFGQGFVTGSRGEMVVFETFGSGLASDATKAGVLAGVMTTRAVLFAAHSVRLERRLGVAIVNPNGTPASVTLTLRRGGDGTTSSSRVITVNPRTQVAKFIVELFDDVADLPQEFDGSLMVVSNIPVAVLGVRFRGSTFSTIPITSLSSPETVPLISAGVGGPFALILPPFAAGGNWSSEIVISNTTAIPLTVRIDLFRQDGGPLTTRLNGQSGSSFQNIVIPAEGLLIANNDDNGPLQVGYAIITPIDTVAPTVTLTVPANNDFGVPTNQKITAAFSEPMDPATISTATFTLTQESAPVSGSVTYSGTTATFTPTNNLGQNLDYIGTITVGSRDLAGNPLANNFVWKFKTTGPAAPPSPALAVISTIPSNGATGVPINQKVSATFNRSMDASTITTTTFTVMQGSTPVAGTIGYLGQTATFTPNLNLTINSTFTGRITTGAKDLGGVALASDHVWTFSTGASADTTAPTIIVVDPVNLATGVAVNKKPRATFSEAMDPLTITTVTFTLKQGVTPVTGTVAYLDLIATFSPLATAKSIFSLF